jgi:hypothetical protein
MIHISEEEKLTPIKSEQSPHLNSRLLMSNLMESGTIEEETVMPGTPIKGPKKVIAKKKNAQNKKKKIKGKKKAKAKFKRIDSEEEDLEEELANFIDNSGQKRKKLRAKRGYVDKKLQEPTVKRSYPKRRERKNITI